MPSNNFPSPYGMGYPVGTPINGSVQNNFPSPYSMGWAEGTPINGSVQNNFASPYNMGWAPGTPINGQTLNNFASPYSMGQPGSYTGGYSAQNNPVAIPGLTTQSGGLSGNVMFDPSQQVAGTTPLASGSTGVQGPASTANKPLGPAGMVGGGVQGPTSPNNAYGSALPTAPPDLASVTDLVNTLNRNAQQQSNAGRIPGAAGLEQQSSGLISDLLSGNIPQDVKRNLTQSAAERGIATGSPGGPNANASLLQSLGLTSLGLQQQGQSNLTAALGRNPGAPIMDPSKLLLTPAEKLAAEARSNALGLAWWQALYGNKGGGGGGRGTGGGQPTSAPENNDWFSNAMRNLTGGRGTPSPSPFAPPSNYPTGTGDFYGGYNPEWPSDYGSYNPAPIDTGYTPPDVGNQDYWNFNPPDYSNDFTYGDPFTGYE